MIAEFNKIEEDKIRNGESGIAVGMAAAAAAPAAVSRMNGKRGKA